MLRKTVAIIQTIVARKMLGILFAIPKTLFNGAFIIPLSDDKNI
jgi:hypothetical protein